MSLIARCILVAEVRKFWVLEILVINIDEYVLFISIEISIDGEPYWVITMSTHSVMILFADLLYIGVFVVYSRNNDFSWWLVVFVSELKEEFEISWLSIPSPILLGFKLPASPS